MRGGWRSFGLVGLYVGAQVVALLLALPFRSAGLSGSTSSAQANNPLAPLYILALIVAAPFVILWIARRSGGARTLRLLILLAITFSLTLTLSATFALLLPAPFYAPPASAAQVIDLSVPAAAGVAVTIFLLLLIWPQWYVVDTAGFLAAGSLIAILGITFSILPLLILLIALAVYDFIAVYRTKHMLSLADVVVDMKLPIVMVMPTGPGYDYTNAPPLKARTAADSGASRTERDAVFMGLGDVVIPGTLVVSAFAFLATGPRLLGLTGNLLVALGTLAGSLAGYAALMRLVNTGRAQAGLPLLNGGAIAGYVLTYLLVFHDPGLGISLAF